MKKKEYRVTIQDDSGTSDTFDVIASSKEEAHDDISAIIDDNAKIVKIEVIAHKKITSLPTQRILGDKYLKITHSMSSNRSKRSQQYRR